MRALQVVWAALVASVVAYTVAAYWATSTGVLTLSVIDPSIMPYASLAALGLMLGAAGVRRVLIRRIDPEDERAARLAAYMNASIVSLAVAESGGLLLLTLGMLSGASGWVLTGGLAAALVMVTIRPNSKDLPPRG